MGLHTLPAELISEIALAAEVADPNIHLTLASVCFHTRQAVLGHLYHSICCPTAQSLSHFADLLEASPQLGPLIRSLRLGPWDILASASTSSHDFSGVNPRATSQRAEEAGRILARCSKLQDLVIWDALLGNPGLTSLHSDTRLKRLSLPYLWRGGHTIPCASAPLTGRIAANQATSGATRVTQRNVAAVMPQLENLEVLEVLLSGLTSADIASIATLPKLRIFCWFYRPLGLSEVEILFRKLDEEWQRRGSRPEGLEIFIAANNGKLAQMEGWLAARAEAEDGKKGNEERSLDDGTDSAQEVLSERTKSLQITEEESEPDPETAFLNARRAAGREGYAPGAAPVLHQPLSSANAASMPASADQSGAAATSARAETTRTSQAPQSTSAEAEASASAPTRAEFILGGFPTEDAEDVYARKLSEWQRRLEERQQAGEATRDDKAIPAAAADEPVDYLCMAGRWLREGRLHFDLRRWRAAVMAWELQWADVWERYECALERARPRQAQVNLQVQAQAGTAQARHAANASDSAASGLEGEGHGESTFTLGEEEERLPPDADLEPFLLAHLVDAVP